MGAGIARANAAPLAERLREMRRRLDEWIALLEAGDAEGLVDEEALRARLAAARARLEGGG
jgi:prephenate dehydrogenase